MQIDTGQDKFELGFEIPEPGKYLFQISEGIDLFINENSGKTSLKIPTKIVEPINGDAGSVGMTVTHFAPIETTYGEKQICSLLTITGLAPYFEGKFSDDTKFTYQKFIDTIKLKLPDKYFKGEIEVFENNKGRKNASFKSWHKAGKQKTISKPSSTESGGVEDW
jgi:hypothetical protein